MSAMSMKFENSLAIRDDWTGTTDRKLRRKMQNRLNQRAYRDRNRRARVQPQQNPLHSPSMEDSSGSVEGEVQRIEQAAYNRFIGSPTSDFLLTLVQYNVFRALLQNTFTLGISTSWLKDEAESDIASGMYNSRVPSALLPTKAQRSKSHHPWLDVLPFPALRDNILRAYDTCDEDALCGAIIGWCNAPGTRTGLIVWGEPWDPCSWEVTEGYYKQFGWTLEGCPDLLAATDLWRACREEEPLRLALE